MMSNEEWERKMEFLLNQQAQFDVDMRRIEATQAETGKFLVQFANSLAEQSYVMFQGFEVLKGEIRELRESMGELRESMGELRESQKLTDETLRKFIVKVDRLTGEGQNGSLN